MGNLKNKHFTLNPPPTHTHTLHSQLEIEALLLEKSSIRKGSLDAQAFSDARSALVYISREFPAVFGELAMLPDDVATEEGMRDNLRRVAPLLARINRNSEVGGQEL